MVQAGFICELEADAHKFNADSPTLTLGLLYISPLSLPPPSLSRSRPTYKAADGNELNGRERRAFVLGRVGVVARPALVCL